MFFVIFDKLVYWILFLEMYFFFGFGVVGFLNFCLLWGFLKWLNLLKWLNEEVFIFFFVGGEGFGEVVCIWVSWVCLVFVVLKLKCICDLLRVFGFGVGIGVVIIKGCCFVGNLELLVCNSWFLLNVCGINWFGWLFFWNDGGIFGLCCWMGGNIFCCGIW